MGRGPGVQMCEEEHGSPARHSDSPEKDYLILLDRAWRVEPKPFTSKKPIIGPFIAAFRRVWNNVAARWYVQGLLEQQVSFNRLAASVIAIHDHQLDEQAQLLRSLSEQLRSLSEQVKSLERQVADLECRLSTQIRLLSLQGELIYDRGLSIGALAEEVARSNVRLHELHGELRALSEQLEKGTGTRTLRK